jgi:hypothetical protein
MIDGMSEADSIALAATRVRAAARPAPWGRAERCATERTGRISTDFSYAARLMMRDLTRSWALWNLQSSTAAKASSSTSNWTCAANLASVIAIFRCVTLFEHQLIFHWNAC